MSPGRAASRREIGRALTRINRASVREALSAAAERQPARAARVGVTGPPGAGKSTLIAGLARHLLDAGQRVGVLAIDPTSPVSSGSILGDRIRMDAVSGEPGLYLRSIPSRCSHDGLSDNIADLLSTLEAHDFDEVILETIGVGQAEHMVRKLVDTVVLVLQPDSGDAVQAMKAGILEIADVCAVNKADLPGADRLVSELRAVLRYRHFGAGAWRPRVVRVSATASDGVGELAAVIGEHRRWRTAHLDPGEVERERTSYHVQSLISRRLGELLEGADPGLFKQPLAEVYRKLVSDLGADLPDEAPAPHASESAARERREHR